MAYNAEKLRFMGGVPGQAVFIYQTPDVKTTVKGSGYFNKAITEYGLSTGDIIHAVTAVDSAGPGGVSLAVKVADGVATVAPFAAT